MDDAAAGRHPLNVAGGDGAAVAHAVAVLHGSGQDVGDGLDAAVRMPGKAGQVILGNVVAEIVEQQERIEVGRVAEAERPAQVHARAFQGGLGLDEPLDGSDGHGDLSICIWLYLGCRQTTVCGMIFRHRMEEDVGLPLQEHRWAHLHQRRQS